MKIYAPVKDFNGLRCGVRFIDGVGETNNPAIAEWFRAHHYRVEKCDNSVRIVEEKCDEEVLNAVIEPQNTEPDFEAMTPNELRDWMRENGYGAKIKNTRNKEKLLEILRS